MRLVAVRDVKKASSRPSMDHRPAGRAACTAQLRGQAYAQWYAVGAVVGAAAASFACSLPCISARQRLFSPCRRHDHWAVRCRCRKTFPRTRRGGRLADWPRQLLGSLGGRGRRARATTPLTLASPADTKPIAGRPAHGLGIGNKGLQAST